MPARAGDRKVNLQKAYANIATVVKREREYLTVPANIEAVKAARAASDAEAKYCWK